MTSTGTSRTRCSGSRPFTTRSLPSSWTLYQQVAAPTLSRCGSTSTASTSRRTNQLSSGTPPNSRGGLRNYSGGPPRHLVSPPSTKKTTPRREDPWNFSGNWQTLTTRPSPSCSSPATVGRPKDTPTLTKRPDGAPAVARELSPGIPKYRAFLSTYCQAMHNAEYLLLALWPPQATAARRCSSSVAASPAKMARH
jgi:hypothetical protein